MLRARLILQDIEYDKQGKEKINVEFQKFHTISNSEDMGSNIRTLNEDLREVLSKYHAAVESRRVLKESGWRS